ncbi:MAG: hypothetical protein M3Y42_04685 [Actinomycetota bacterium]|nr:hypothetical protein [Actinomycetota bacterium]MDQ2956243.1 hypothetical protein [Actinomycetota bacterium]
MSETILLVQGVQTLTRAVREVLRDWSAIELVSQVLWIGFDSTADRLAGVLIGPAGTEVVEPAEWIARAKNSTATQVVVLQIPGTGSRLASFAEVTARIDQLGLPQGSRPVQVFAPSTDTPTLDPGSLWSSHVNVMLQPVDGHDPHSLSIRVRSDEPRFAMHVAAGIASVAGLWQGVEVPVWGNGGHQLVGQLVSVGRTYFRRLDSSQVLLTLESEVLPTGRQFPTPYDRSRPLPPVQPGQQAAAVHAAVISLLRANPVALFHPPPEFVPAPRKKIGFLQAIRDLLSFIGTSLIALPGEWARRLVRRFEDSVTHSIYGDESGFQVQLGRVSELGNDAVENLRGEIAEAMTRYQLSSTAPDTAALWQGVVQTVCGLADGDALAAGVPPPVAAGERAVITDPSVLVVDPEAEPYRFDYGVLPGVDTFQIAPTDPLAAILLDRQLAHQVVFDGGGQSSSGVAIGTRRASLGSWLQREKSLMGSLVHGIAEECNKAIGTLESANSDDDFMAQQELRQQVNACQRKVRRLILLSLLVLAAVLLLVAGLAVLAVLSILIAATLFVVALLGWLLASSRIFLRQQRSLYKLLHRMDVERLHRRWAADSIAHLINEIDRLTAVYRQATMWNQILSVAIRRPFGTRHVTEVFAHRPGMLRGDLPLSMAVGAAEIEPTEQRPLLRDIQRGLFKVGWLSQRVHERLDAIVAEQNLPDRALDQIWSDSGLNPRDPLNVIAQEIASPRLDTAMRVQCRSNLVAWLDERQAQTDGPEWLHAGLAGSVKITAGAVPGSIEPSVADFVEPLLWVTGQLPSSGFTSLGITEAAPAIEHRIVASVGLSAPAELRTLRTSALAGSHALDRIVVRIDLTRPLGAGALTCFTATAPGDPWDVDDNVELELPRG